MIFMQERFYDFLQIPSFYLSVHFGKIIWYSKISSITFTIKLTMLSFSMAKSFIFSEF